MNNILQFKKVKFMGKLTKEKMLEIEKKVNDILLKFNIDTDTHYIDIVSLVKKDGFTVQAIRMPVKTTGRLYVMENHKKLITVNTNFKNPDNEDDVIFKKSRFITAHEYGHYILHKFSGVPLFAHRDSDNRSSQKELEADYFARSLLMPLESFNSYYNTLKNIYGQENISLIIDMLSLLFKVTRNKINKRIDDLNILCN